MQVPDGRRFVVNVPEGVEVGEQLVISVPDDGLTQAALETRAFVGKLIALHEMAEARGVIPAGVSHSASGGGQLSRGSRRMRRERARQLRAEGAVDGQRVVSG